jgi:peptidoglycan/xylan/chitin deacetylase (PgdA/CDA1 family)
MKKTTLIFALIAVVAVLNATVYIDETFSYSVSNLADETTWTTALTNGTAINGTGRNIVTPALTYSNSGGYYVLSNTGKAIYNDYLNTANITYTSVKPIGTTISSTVFTSFLYKAGAAQGQTQSTVFGLATGTSVGPTLWVGKGVVNAANFRFGVTRSSTTGTDVKWTTTEYSDINEVFLIVLKHDFETGITSLYINPTIDGTEPATPIVTDNAGTARTSLNNLLLRNSGNNRAIFTISGVRVSSTWAEAVASSDYTPPVSTALPAPEIGVATNLAAKSFTANWQAVANATAYTIQVYTGTTFVDSTVVSGQGITSATVENLIPELTYTYKVKARGDGVNHTNSVLSAASQAFTLLAATIPNNNLKVILKLDDLGVQNSVLACSHAFDFMVANKIKWGAGAIAVRFDATAPGVLEPYMNATNNQGEKLMEIWHHGYDHSQNNPTGTWEYSGRTYADQKLSFENADQTIKNLLGVQMRSFGTPYNQSDAVTNTVIAENTNYKVFMFSKIKSTTNGVMYLDNRVNMENGTGLPDYSFFLKNYSAQKANFTDYMILQGHPNYFTAGSNNLEQYKLILKFLVSEGVEFVTPYEYYQSTLTGTGIIRNGATVDNPFNFSIYSASGKQNTTMRFELNEPKNLTFSMYNLTGSLVKQSFYAQVSAGKNSIQLDVSDLQAGTYLCKLTDEENAAVQKLIVQ